MGRRRRSTAITSREVLVVRSAGDVGIGLVRDCRQNDRMAAMLSFTDSQRRTVRVELTAHDVLHLAADAQRLLGADAAQVAQWWTELTGIPPLVALDDADAASATTHLRSCCRRAHGSLCGQYRAAMMDQPYAYLELLASIVDDDGSDGQRTYVLRALTPAEVAEVGADLHAADQRGEDIETVLAAWSIVRVEP